MRGPGDVGQHAVQRVAEFVEQRARLVERQQRRLALGRLGEVHHVVDDRARAAAEPVARLQTAHPGAGALRRAGEIVGEEDAAHRAVGVAHLEGAHVRMPGGNASRSTKVTPNSRAATSKQASMMRSSCEIGLQLRLVEGVFLGAQLLLVEAPVPAGDLLVAAGRGRQALQVGLVERRPFRAPSPRPARAGRTPPRASWPSCRRASAPHSWRSRAASPFRRAAPASWRRRRRCRVAPPFSPRPMKARNAFSRRSRRSEKVVKGS